MAYTNNFSNGKKEKKEITGGDSLPVQAYKAPSVNESAVQNLAQLRAGYKPEQDSAVVAAKSKLDALQKPSESVQLRAVRDKVLNRSPFIYDMNEDMLYQQYKDSYTRQGKLAMQDTMGQAAALTGGYGNSYATTAGQQTYNGYMQHLNDVVPQLYQLAYDRYQNEQNANRQDLATLYGEYRDQVGDYYNDWGQLSNEYWKQYDAGHTRWSDQYNAAIDERDFAYNSAIDERNFQYQKERDAHADAIDERNFAYQKEQDARAAAIDERNFQYQKERDALKDGSETGVGLYTYSRTEGNTSYFYDSEGKEVKRAKGINPYNGGYNKDIENGVFSNGYQPDNIDGVKVQRVKDEDGQNARENVNGRWQQVWYTEKYGMKTYYLWDGLMNEYRLADEYYAD